MASMIVDDVPRSASAADAAAAVNSIEMVLAALEPGAAQPNGGPAAAAVDAQSKSLGADSLLRPVSSRAARRPTCCPPPQSPDPSRPKGSFAPRVVGRGAPLRHVRRQRKSGSRHGCCNCRCRHRSARRVGRDAARASTCELSMGSLLSPPPATSIFQLRHAVPAPPSLTLPICARPGAAAGSKPPPLPFTPRTIRIKGLRGRPFLFSTVLATPSLALPICATLRSRIGLANPPDQAVAVGGVRGRAVRPGWCTCSGCHGRRRSRSSGSTTARPSTGSYFNYIPCAVVGLSRSAAIAVERFGGVVLVLTPFSSWSTAAQPIALTINSTYFF